LQGHFDGGAGFALGLLPPKSEVWRIRGDGACGFGLAVFDNSACHGVPVIAAVGNDASRASSFMPA